MFLLLDFHFARSLSSTDSVNAYAFAVEGVRRFMLYSPFHNAMPLIQLSEGFLVRFETDSPVNSTVSGEVPTLQLLSLRRIVRCRRSPIYQVLVSDGLGTMRAFLGQQMMDLVETGWLNKFTVVEVDEYSHQTDGINQ